MFQFTVRSTARVTAAALAIAVLGFLPGLAQADTHEGNAASQLKAQIMKDNEYNRKNLTDAPDGVSKDGSLEFWSSGGLLQSVSADSPATMYKAFSLTPKNIEVIMLPGGEAAVAMYYSEGSMQTKGGPEIGHYMTRAMQVYVKEGGTWKLRAAHWSPIAAGAGTSQSSIN